LFENKDEEKEKKGINICITFK